MWKPHLRRLRGIHVRHPCPYYPPFQVADTVGAGDAFLAAFLLERLRGAPAPAALKQACRLGAYVASMPGATPQIDEVQLAMLQARAAAAG